MKFIFVVPAYGYAKRLSEISFICSAEDVIKDKQVSDLLIVKNQQDKGRCNKKMGRTTDTVQAIRQYTKGYFY